jgi:hypothetical protein
MRKGINLYIGLGLLTIGLSLFYFRVFKLKEGIVTNATVLRIDSKQDGEDMLYRPVLSFINYKNEPLLYKPAYGTDDWYIGEKVKFFYTKDNYDDVSILSYWSTFGVVLLFICGASVFLFNVVGKYLAGRFFKTLIRSTPIG